ncbi:MAG: serine--tRNA ligase, partial [Bacteroidetes bacterium]|nr:serine--tRNA ligase [Bacteroidota bacterium]
MLDIKFIRENSERVRQGAASKGIDVDIDALLSLDDKRKELIQEGDSLKAKRNQISAEVGKIKRTGGDASSLIANMESIKERIQLIDRELRDIDEKIQELLLSIPNLPHESVPFGKTPADNQVVFQWGASSKPDFELKPHWELAEKLGII